MLRQSAIPLVSFALLIFTLSLRGADVLTQRNDNARSGLNLTETNLTPASIKPPGAFGKLYSRLLDGNCYAQPLYVSGLEIRNQARNVLFAATENNTVYAFEDDARETHSQPLWTNHLAPAIAASELSEDLKKGVGGCDNITMQVGITGTPAIDRKNNVLYVEAKTKSEGKYAQLLFALDIRTGKILRKTAIEGSAAGHGIGSDDSGRIVFQPEIQFNRPAMLLDHGRLYVAFGSHCDTGEFHGWIFAYNAANFQLLDIFITTPNTRGQYNGQGAIWQSGTGPAADMEGNIYVTVANGGYAADAGDFGDTILKLKTDNGKFAVAGWFSPTNQEILKIQDADLGSTGTLLVPGTTLLAAGSKEGKMYLLDAATMDGPVSPLQEIQVTPGPHYFASATDYGAVRYWNIHGTPLYYQSAAGQFLYVCGEEDPVRAFHMVTTNVPGSYRIDPPTSFATSDERAAYPPERAKLSNPPVPNPDVWMPGGFLALSANGNSPNTAILWALMPLDGSATARVVHGVLRAFDAVNFVARPDGSRRIQQLWSSDHDGNQSSDSLGMYPKFSCPTIVNGRVIVTTFSEETVAANGLHEMKKGGLPATLTVYGLLVKPR